MTLARPTLQFDDIIYSLQTFGGIMEYWTQLTSRIRSLNQFDISRVTGTTRSRVWAPRCSAAVFHSSYFRIPRFSKSKKVVTVHDMAYERGLMGRGLNVSFVRAERKHAYLNADAIICISEATRNDLLGLFPQLAQRAPIAVIHHGVTFPANDAFASQGSETHCRPYMLFVGGRGHYKNFVGALRGFRASRLAKDGYVLKCTGSALSQSEEQLVASLGLANQVQSVGNVTRAELASLYANAHALLYTSTFEGFGMPMLEAMTSGCPVIASNCSCIPEIAGDGAILVAPDDENTIGRAVDALASLDTRSELIARGRRRATAFSWERSAAEHASLYQSLIESSASN